MNTDDKTKLLYIDNIVRLYDAGMLTDKETIDKIMKIVWSVNDLERKHFDKKYSH